MTALHHAAIGGQEESARVLVQELKVHPDICDVVSNRRSVLHALLYNHNPPYYC